VTHILRWIPFCLLFSVIACESEVTSTKPKKVVKKSAEPEYWSRHRIAKNSSTYDALTKAGIPPKTIYALVKAAKPVSRLDKVKIGTTFEIHWENSEKKKPMKLIVRKSIENSLWLTAAGEVWKSKLVTLPSTTKIKSWMGTVETNLWESAVKAGMQPSLISDLTSVFAWQIDFSREVREGDRWRMVVETKYIEDQAVSPGKILVADYQTKRDRYSGVRFPKEDPFASFYSPDGQSLRRMFLKSPIKFGRITSRFSKKRFHPILKRNKPHNGVDYGAPRGTPVMAVGDGVVLLAARRGNSGKTVKIRHNSTYQTAYLHLNGFAKGIKRNRRVKQGQVIGYVGSTGLATGPHLHFSFYENGRYVDPLGRKFPSADPVPKVKMEAFKKVSQAMMPLLPPWPEAAPATM